MVFNGHTNLKTILDAVVLDEKVGIRAIVRDANGDVFLAMENHFPMTGFVELVEAIATLNGISKSFEASISLLWVESDFKILQNLLVGNYQYANETQTLVDVIRDFQYRSFVLVFTRANRRCNSVAHV